MPTRRPNIVVLMADQLAPQFMGCYGHPVVQTPFLDELASNGVVFDAAYTNSPLCAPSRAVMMTGRQASRIDAWDNAAEFPAEVPTFAHYLCAAGYRTCLSGKMHFVGPDQLHGFEERLTTDVYPSDFTWHAEWDRPGERLDWYHNMEVVTKAGVCTRSMYLDYDDEAVFKAKRWLFERARDDGDQPFMLMVSLIQPHDPYLCRSETWDLYEGRDIDLPQTPLGSVAEDPHTARLRHCYGASDLDVSDEMLVRARRAYYGATSDVDAKCAEVVRALTEAGLADDTIIIFTSDHGDMLGERGLWFKMSYLEHSARVPLIVHAPGEFSPRRVSAAVSLVDLLPTLAELAGDGQAPEYVTAVEGRSLVGHLGGAGGHDEVIGEYFAEGVSTPMFMVRRGTRKLIQCATDPVQLFDLDDDPHERTNLADDARHADDVGALVEELEEGYDVDALTERVHESQRRRRFLKKIMRDQNVAWDHEPGGDATTSYVRNSMPIYELEKRARFPQA